jgi:hypothetical protein
MAEMFSSEISAFTGLRAIISPEDITFHSQIQIKRCLKSTHITRTSECTMVRVNRFYPRNVQSNDGVVTGTEAPPT